MKNTLLILVLILPLLTSCSGNPDEQNQPINILYVTGGGFHDYEAQLEVVKQGLSERLDFEWTVDFEAEDRNDHVLTFVQDPDWHEPYDVVIYNMCFAAVTDDDYIEKLVYSHYESGTAALMLHCAMHTFRDAETKEWDRFVGLESYRHERQREMVIEPLNLDHPAMADFPEDRWESPIDELYIVLNTYSNLVPLAHSYGVETEEYHITKWANTYGNARVIGTTSGHNTAVMEEPVYLDFLANSIRWLVNGE